MGKRWEKKWEELKGEGWKVKGGTRYGVERDMGSVQLSMYFLSGCTDFWPRKGGRGGEKKWEVESGKVGWEWGCRTSKFERPMVNE
jgi:hypothetical protein